MVKWYTTGIKILIPTTKAKKDEKNVIIEKEECAKAALLNKKKTQPK